MDLCGALKNALCNLGLLRLKVHNNLPGNIWYKDQICRLEGEGKEMDIRARRIDEKCRNRRLFYPYVSKVEMDDMARDIQLFLEGIVFLNTQLDLDIEQEAERERAALRKKVHDGFDQRQQQQQQHQSEPQYQASSPDEGGAMENGMLLMGKWIPPTLVQSPPSPYSGAGEPTLLNGYYEAGYVTPNNNNNRNAGFLPDEGPFIIPGTPSTVADSPYKPNVERQQEMETDRINQTVVAPGNYQVEGRPTIMGASWMDGNGDNVRVRPGMDPRRPMFNGRNNFNVGCGTPENKRIGMTPLHPNANNAMDVLPATGTGIGTPMTIWGSPCRCYQCTLRLEIMPSPVSGHGSSSGLIRTPDRTPGPRSLSSVHAGNINGGNHGILSPSNTTSSKTGSRVEVEGSDTSSSYSLQSPAPSSSSLSTLCACPFCAPHLHPNFEFSASSSAYSSTSGYCTGSAR